MRLIWTALLLAAPLVAQTKVPITQLKAPAAQAPAAGVYTLLAFTSAGPMLVTVPAGTTVVAGQLVLPGLTIDYDVALSSNAGQTVYSLPITYTTSPRAVAVYRNGVRQRPGADYTWDPTGKTATVIGASWNGDDTVTADVLR